MSGYMGFVGVSTAQSSIMRVFPAWAHALGLPTDRLVGEDVALDASRDEYRRIVRRIAADDDQYGALVTTHKMSIYSEAGDLFDELDELAVTFGELSSISKRDGKLRGSAKDPVTVRLALKEFLAPDHFQRSGAAAVVLGAGGSGNALSYNLGIRADRPAMITVVARRTESLNEARSLHARAGIDPDLMRYVLATSAEDVDAVVGGQPAGSLIVNATGMGKDRPGSPLSDTAVFPCDAVVWEFNYRGTLEFLHQAQRQAGDRGLKIEDGWRYFIHGWSQVVEDVFHIDIDAETVDRLAQIAEAVR